MRNFLNLLLTLLWIGNSYSQSIKIIDCETLIPIEDVIVVNEYGKVLGFTNKDGVCSTYDFKKIRLTGINIKDTTIQLSRHFNNSVLCLKSLNYLLDTFSIVKQVQDIKQQYVKQLENAHKNMLKSDTSLYYDFVLKTAIPDSSWNETITGTLKLSISSLSKKRVYGRVFLCEANQIITPYFESSYSYNLPINNMGCLTLLNVDFMFSNPKKIDESINTFVDSVVVSESPTKTIYFTGLKNKEMYEKMNFKEITVFNEDILSKITYYSTTKNTNINNLNEIYREIIYTNTNSSYIEKIIQKAIKSHQNVIFVTELEVSLAKDAPEKCMEKPIGMKAYNSNYATFMLNE